MSDKHNKAGKQKQIGFSRAVAAPPRAGMSLYYQATSMMAFENESWMTPDDGERLVEATKQARSLLPKEKGNEANKE